MKDEPDAARAEFEMSLNRPPSPVNMTLNLAPMVDVLMCLIIFFLLASKIVAAQQFPILLPWAVGAKEEAEADLGARVTIIVRRVDERDIEAEYVVLDFNGHEFVEKVLQPEEVAGLLKARARHAREDGQKLRCVIRADREVMYKHVEVVLRGCGLAEIADVVFPAEQPGGVAEWNASREGRS